MIARATLRAEIAQRQRMNDLLPFGAAGQAIMLDLALARVEGRRSIAKDACIAAFGKSGHASAFRYIALLEEAGLITRGEDWNDRRLHVLRITDEGFARVAAALAPAQIAKAA
jgi:hypothetical protein